MKPRHLASSAVPVRARLSPRASRRVRGVTLIELMITLVVASVLVTVGLPTFMRALARHAIAANAEELQDAVRVARNESMKRSGPVILCRTEPATPGHCADGAGSWQTWLLFADSARTGAFAAGDEIVRQHPESSRRMTVTSKTAVIRFEATGIAHADVAPVAISLAPSGGASGNDVSARRQVCINPRGEVFVVEGEATCP